MPEQNPGLTSSIGRDKIKLLKDKAKDEEVRMADKKVVIYSTNT